MTDGWVGGKLPRFPCILDAGSREEIPMHLLRHPIRGSVPSGPQPESLSAKVMALNSAEALLIVS